MDLERAVREKMSHDLIETSETSEHIYGLEQVRPASQWGYQRMATVELDHIKKVYPNGTVAVSEVDLTIGEGEFMVLVGPSGCGKTTLLRMIAGLEDITSGTLTIGNRTVNDEQPKDRDIAMVFQNYALYPHMTVAENIGFALKLRKMPKDEITKKVSEAAKILGLTEFLNIKPGQLSGGQRQRVAMGRAIVREPAVFLMDEPLSNLDAKLRVQMRAEISRIQRKLGVATIYVTHDQIEAMTMGDRVAVINAGVLQQCDTPTALYDRPINLFVAAFIGSPSMNLYEADLSPDGSSITVGADVIRLPPELVEAHTQLAQYRGRKLAVGIRPEHLSFPSTPPAANQLTTTIELVEALGSETLVHFRCDATPIRLDLAVNDGEEIIDLPLIESTSTTHRALGVARINPIHRVQQGDLVAFEVAAARLHFFDLDSGLSL
jgi:multiple sugar transport system ATP-binding protein